MNRSEMIRAVGPSREELISWCPAPKGFTPADSEMIAATTMSRPEAIGLAQGPRSQRDTVLMGMPFGPREGAEGQDPGGGVTARSRRWSRTGWGGGRTGRPGWRGRRRGVVGMG